jgi:hypothetical protein
MHNVTRIGTLDVKRLFLDKAELVASAADLNVLAGAARPGASLKRVAAVPLGAADTPGGVLAWQNPEGQDILVNQVVLDVVADSTGASTVDVGTTTVGPTTSSDNLIDGLDTGSAPILADNLQNHGTNGKTVQRLAAGKWITASKASGSVAGLAGQARIEYLLA